MKKTIKEILYILLLAGTSSLLYNIFFDSEFPLVYEAVEFSAGSVLTTQEALHLSKSKDVLFIDARDTDDYAGGHIKGALNLSVHSSRAEKISFFTKYSKNQKIVVYCFDADCPSAERLAKEMGFMGYKNVMIYPGGWSAWEDAGYPIEKEETHG
jgi:rhodanese-related sulfurtransferase